MSYARFFHSGEIEGPALAYLVRAGLYRLNSFYYLSQWDKLLAACDLQERKPKLLYDSGAFSAWSKDKEIDRDAYARKCEEIMPHCEEFWMINLDQIPGKKGVTPTQSEIDRAVEVSIRNWDWLAERFGKDTVLPVYHQGESFEVLEEMLRHEPGYICVSPRNDVPEKSRSAWCNRVFEKIPSHVKAHGLATTGWWMIKNSPWTSVDSASGVYLAAYGDIIVGERWKILTVTDNEDRRREGAHYDNISGIERQWFHNLMNEWGFTLTELREDHNKRVEWNIRAYETLNPEHKDHGTAGLLW